MPDLNRQIATAQRMEILNAGKQRIIDLLLELGDAKVSVAGLLA